MNTQPVFLTIITRNYVSQARCLFESLRVQHPDARHILCLVDETIDSSIFAHDEFEVVLANQVVGPCFYEMAYKYSLTELCTSIKPFVMKYLLDKGADFVIYIDPDCFLFSPLDEIFELFANGANIVLTPHSTAPIDDAKTPGEIDFLRVGTFNLGFIAVRSSVETSRFLGWWSDRLRDLCRFDPLSGLFVDQKWVDLAPSMFEDVHILRHPGYNVAYWNAFQRLIERRPGGWHVDGEPMRFFHFSALPQDDVSRVSRHQDRLDGNDLGAFISEFQTYLARLASNSLAPDQEAEYPYSLVWQGRRIDSQALRASLRRAGTGGPKSLEDFKNEEPIFALLRPLRDLPIGEMFPISQLLYDAWMAAPVVARNYPLFTAEQRARFFYWVLREGHVPLQLHPSLLPWRELTTPVPGAVGGRLPVPPIVWLVWLSDKNLRRSTRFDDELSFAKLLIDLQRDVGEGDRPNWVLPVEYTRSTVIGDESQGDGVNVAQYALWLTRSDLNTSFDLEAPQARRAFNAWCNSSSPAAECPWMVPLISAAGKSTPA